MEQAAAGRGSLTWGQAVLLGFAIAAAAFVVLAIVPHLIVTRRWTEARAVRELAAVAWFGASFVGVVVALRRLQRRGLT